MLTWYPAAIVGPLGAGVTALLSSRCLRVVLIKWKYASPAQPTSACSEPASSTRVNRNGRHGAAHCDASACPIRPPLFRTPCALDGPVAHRPGSPRLPRSARVDKMPAASVTIASVHSDPIRELVPVVTIALVALATYLQASYPFRGLFYRPAACTPFPVLFRRWAPQGRFPV